MTDAGGELAEQAAGCRRGPARSRSAWTSTAPSADRARAGGGPATGGRGRAARAAGRPVRGRGSGLGASGRLPGRARRRPWVRYLGLYGLQEIRDGQVRVDQRLEAGRPAVEAAQQDLRDHPAVRDSGAWLEDKRYSAAVHTRRVADPDCWAGPIDQSAREIACRVQKPVHAARQWYSLSSPPRRSRRCTRPCSLLMAVGPAGGSGGSSPSARCGRWTL
jgi:hypothetical protein